MIILFSNLKNRLLSSFCFLLPAIYLVYDGSEILSLQWLALDSKSAAPKTH